MKTLKNLSFLMMTAALLSSCQRAASYKTTTYQERANKTLSQMAGQIDKGLRGIKGTKATAFGAMAIWDINQGPPAGGYFTNNPQDLMETCMRMLDALRTTISDQAALSKIYQCGLALVAFQNPAFTMANRQLDYMGLAYNGYNNAYNTGGAAWSDFTGIFRQGIFTQYQQYGFVPNQYTFSQ